jgi:hypothetical protein
VSGGVLIGGRLVPVPGVNVIPPASHGGPAWCTLNVGDYQLRRRRVQQAVIHSTKGDEPQRVIAGAGPGGMAERTFRYWTRDPVHSAAQVVIDNNGDLACGADLAEVCAYHATVSNEYSFGIELYQEADNGIYEAVYATLTKALPIILDALAIPYFVVADPYAGHPLRRFLDGAPDFYGVLGHRHNTEQRGRGDPGDEAFRRMIAGGGEPVIAESHQDIALSRARQRTLNAMGGHLDVDGLAGAASIAEAKRQGYARWSDVMGEAPAG